MKFTNSSVVALFLGVVLTKETSGLPAACGIQQTYTKANTVFTGPDMQINSPGTSYAWFVCESSDNSEKTAVTTLSERDFLGPEYCDQMKVQPQYSGEQAMMQVGTATFQDWNAVQGNIVFENVRLLYDRNSQSVNGYKCPTITSANDDCQHFWNAVDTTVYASNTLPKIQWTLWNNDQRVIQISAEPVRKMISAANPQAYTENPNNRQLNTEVSKLNTEVSLLKTDNSKLNTEVSQLKTDLSTTVEELKKEIRSIMASPIVKNNLKLQEKVYSLQENDIQLSTDNVHLREENAKIQKQYLDLKTRTETTQDIEVSDLSGSVSTGGIACLSIAAIGLVTATYVMKDSKKRNSQKGSMYLLENEEIR